MKWIETPVKNLDLNQNTLEGKPCGELVDVDGDCYYYNSCKSKSVGC